MSAATDGPTILIAPHRFPSLSAEEALAEDTGLELVAAGDAGEFAAALPRAGVVLVTPYVRVDAAAIAAAARCRAIIRYGAGVDNVDVAVATRAGIPVANIPDAATEEVALHAVALITALVRRLPAAGDLLRTGDWRTNVMTGVRRFSAITVGLVGVGRIGALTAKHLTALGATVIVNDPAADGTYEQVTVDELLRRSDVVSLHVPLTDQTRDVLSARRIACMKPGAIVVNVSRGGLVDEEAVAAALVEGRLSGAGLDVFATEPLPTGHPLLVAPNAILTPHVAWRAEESLRDYQVKAVEQARLALAGRRMTSVVDIAAYDAAMAMSESTR